MAKRRSLKIGTLLLGTLLLTVCLLSLRLGSAEMSWETFLSALFTPERNEAAALILRYVRLPRLLASLLAGVGLSLSGLLLQTVTDNAMASPSLVGVNAGAGFAVILSLTLLPVSYTLLPLFAFLGAFGATALIVALGAKMGMKKSTLVLTGLAIHSVLSAGISFLSLLDTDALTAYNAFSVGSLSGVSLPSLALPLAFVLASILFSALFSHGLSLLSLGDGMARALGVKVSLLRILAMLAASLSAAAAVSFAGLLGFVGLLSPHIARRLFGGSFRRLLLPTLLVGALTVSMADMLGRILLAPTEIPVGVLMALLGAPFFLFLLLRKGEDYA